MKLVAPPGIDASSDAERLAAHGAELENLLAEIQASVGPSAWPKIELLVRSLLELYGVGLERLLALARPLHDELGERVSADDLLSSLLALHGLHPLPVEQRIERSLAALAKRAPIGSGCVELAKLEHGRLTLRVVGVDDPLLARSLAQLAMRAIDEAAPELEQIELEPSSLLMAPTHSPSPQLISPERLVSGGRA